MVSLGMLTPKVLFRYVEWGPDYSGISTYIDALLYFGYSFNVDMTSIKQIVDEYYSAIDNNETEE